MIPVPGDAGILSAAGVAAGLAWFFKGFRAYREYRRVEHTPLIPIRGVAMGLTHIHGKAKGEIRLKGPVTRSDCFFYKVEIERWVKDSSAEGGHWSHQNTVTGGVPFYLEDGSGRVLVNPFGAEYDLIGTGRREIGAGPTWRRLLGKEGERQGLAQNTDQAPSDDELRSFIEQAGCGYRNLVLSLSDHRPSAKEGIRRGALGPEWSLVPAASAGGRFRLSEYCILPEHWYDVTGTCAENRNARNEAERRVITKGAHEPTFRISWRSQPGVESERRHRAALHVFGGAALGVACLAVLLLQLGQG